MKKLNLKRIIIVYAIFLCMPALATDACSDQSVVGDVCTTSIDSIRPTQFSVGLIEVQAKSSVLQSYSSAKLDKYLANHTAPTVIGPQHEFYITDRHHLARALLGIGMDQLYLNITDDYSSLSVADFWQIMQKRGLDYLYDHGQGPMAPALLPHTIATMSDDVYRSLAWAIQDQTGAYASSTVLFASLMWANFFRSRVPESLIASDFAQAVQQGAVAARSSAAAELPGYIGPGTAKP